MGPTEWTVLSTGLVIILANAAAFRSLRSEFRSELKDLRKEMTDNHNALRKEFTDSHNALRKEMTEGFNALRQEMGELRERMAHLEGLLEGLRESIDRAGRNVA